ncbi:hypothetical protein [Bradyrhizobium iriomotense]|uniref:Uncharacterized protein n=1 Tax=Bradyrhizobium iriomotense TaxID=441950 RepID=A0ABQ6B552_9BRAD|nr:hypothetical protein [Bradyrhizobium iriomotense]GLR87756.1 hypothetical protein GCM10007857_44670 [Bradyrhizobium iriomotense]
MAHVYGGRWEVTSRLSWNALVELSSRSVPEPVRREFERKIIAGRRVGAPEIRRARPAAQRAPAAVERSAAANGGVIVR